MRAHRAEFVGYVINAILMLWTWYLISLILLEVYYFY